MQVLIDGCFNADPHPGNILCADGKLALIDYGQVSGGHVQCRHLQRHSSVQAAPLVSLLLFR